MYLADFNTGSRFSHILKRQFNENDYWIDDWWSWKPVQLKNWDGAQDIKSVITQSTCVVLRGTKRGRAENFLKRQLPGLIFDKVCNAGDELVRTVGVNCKGHIIPKKIDTSLSRQ